MQRLLWIQRVHRQSPHQYCGAPTIQTGAPIRGATWRRERAAPKAAPMLLVTRRPEARRYHCRRFHTFSGVLLAHSSSDPLHRLDDLPRSRRRRTTLHSQHLQRILHGGAMRVSLDMITKKRMTAGGRPMVGGMIRIGVTGDGEPHTRICTCTEWVYCL